MSSVFVARRRAEEFNSLVEGDSTGVAPGTRFHEQFELVEQLREVPRPEPRPEFTADLRAQLLAAADTLLLPSDDDTRRLTLPPRRTARDRRVAAAVGGLAVVGATTSLAVAAQSALPGEMLYPLKRAMESAETEIHTSKEARGESLLVNATHRLDEAAALSRDGDLAEGEHVAQALLDFADQATLASDLLLADYDQTGDERSIEGLREFTAESMETLTVLEGILPEPARDELRYAAQVIDEIDDAAALACPACSGGIAQIPPVLLSAGQVAEPSILLPPVLVPATDIRPEEGRRAPGGSKGDPKSGNGKGNGGAGDTAPDPLPSVGDAVPDTGGGSESGGSNGGGKGPIGNLTDSLTGGGGGDTSTSGGGGGLTGVPPVDETVDGVVEDLDDTVGGLLPDLP